MDWIVVILHFKKFGAFFFFFFFFFWSFIVFTPSHAYFFSSWDKQLVFALTVSAFAFSINQFLVYILDFVETRRMMILLRSILKNEANPKFIESNFTIEVSPSLVKQAPLSTISRPTPIIASRFPRRPPRQPSSPLLVCIYLGYGVLVLQTRMLSSRC